MSLEIIQKIIKEAEFAARLADDLEKGSEIRNDVIDRNICRIKGLAELLKAEK